MLSLLLLRAAAGSGVSVPPNHGDRPHIVFFMVRSAMNARQSLPTPACWCLPHQSLTPFSALRVERWTIGAGTT